MKRTKTKKNLRIFSAGIFISLVVICEGCKTCNENQSSANTEKSTLAESAAEIGGNVIYYVIPNLVH